LNGTAVEVVEELLIWLEAHPNLVTDLIRPDSLEGLFDENYKKLSDDMRSRRAVEALRSLWPLWMSGAPLCKLEAAFLGKTNGLGHCKHARHFVSRIVPDLAFLAGLPGRLMAARLRAASDEKPVPMTLAILGGIVREGCDSPESLATRLNCGRSMSRVAARTHFDKIKIHIPARIPAESFEDTRERMRHADAVWTFDNL
jgi:hypothetical protein